MVETRRAVPAMMLDAWERATKGPDPIAALRATKALWQHLAQWQSVLVSEAVNATATWDEIGLALGTTRQAAWARFRKWVERASGGTRPMQEEISKAGKQAVEQMKSVREHLKRLDSKWREERKRLQDEIRTLQDQIRTFDKQRADDRKTRRTPAEGNGGAGSASEPRQVGRQPFVALSAISTLDIAVKKKRATVLPISLSLKEPFSRH